MSKDFMTLVDMGVCSKEKALRGYISHSFYPSHPQYVVESMVKGFKKYWKGKATLEELKEACYLRDIDGLYQYFGQFLKEEI